MDRIRGEDYAPVPLAEDGVQAAPLIKAPESHSKRRHPFALLSWKWEVLSLLVSVVCLTGILVTLSCYNGVPQPSWIYGLKLNSLIAIFSTILRAQLIVVAAESISQLKWAWFGQPRPVRQLDLFDRASRGFFGSLMFMLRSGGVYWALLGGIVIILSAAIGPFSQQAITTFACQVPMQGVNATIPIANYAGAGDVRFDFLVYNSISWPLTPQMKSTILNGLVISTFGDTSVSPSCPTGNCQFPGTGGVSYSSVAYCSSCVDITPDIQQTWVDNSDYTGWNYTLPGLFLAPGGGVDYPWVNAAPNANFWTTTEVKGGNAVEIAVMAFTFANCTWLYDGMQTQNCTRSNTQLSSLEPWLDVVAANCTLGLCVRNYHAEVQNGILNERTESSIPANRTFDYKTNIYSIFKAPCLVDGLTYDASNVTQVANVTGRNFTSVYVDGRQIEAPNDCVYQADADLPSGVNEFLATLLSGSCCHQYPMGGTEPVSTIFCGDANWWLEPLYGSGNASLQSISALMENVTVAITNRMRTTGLNAAQNASGEAVGVVIEASLCTNVEWPWLVLPILATGLMLVLFLAVVLQSWDVERTNQPVWKSSILPALFYGIEARDDSKGQLAKGGGAGNAGGPASLAEMEEDADNMVAQLGPTASGWGFVLQNDPHQSFRSLG